MNSVPHMAIMALGEPKDDKEASDKPETSDQDMQLDDALHTFQEALKGGDPETLREAFRAAVMCAQNAPEPDGDEPPSDKE